jgi:hypothetical protein
VIFLRVRDMNPVGHSYLGRESRMNTCIYSLACTFYSLHRTDLPFFHVNLNPSIKLLIFFRLNQLTHRPTCVHSASTFQSYSFFECLYEYFCRDFVISKRTILKDNLQKLKQLLQALTDPDGSRKVEALRFQENRHMRVIRLSAIRTGRFYPQEIFLVLWY